MKWFGRILLVLLAIILVALVAVKLLYGGGDPYPDVSTAPVIPEARISAPIQLPYPPGMVSVSRDGRVFYTYHMLHKPELHTDATVFEWITAANGGTGVPFPNQAAQADFHGAMGITTDAQNRFWVIKPGALEGRPTRLLAYDMASGEKLIDHEFDKRVGGFAQDLRVTPDGRHVILADTGIFRFLPPSLIVFDVAAQSSRVVLQGHPTLSPQDWVMRKTDGSDYKLFFGLLSFVVGVDGIAFSKDGQWVYFATMSHDSAYRVPTAALLDDRLSDAEIAAQIDLIGKKPLSDGIELTADNTLIITDVENGGLAALHPDGRLETLTKEPSIDWADSTSIGPDGAIWFTDSRLTALIDQFAQPSDGETLRANGPYAIWRVAPEAGPAPEPAPDLEAEVPNTAPPDTEAPNAEMTDTEIPDAETPDTAVPDARVSAP